MTRVSLVLVLLLSEASMLMPHNLWQLDEGRVVPANAIDDTHVLAIILSTRADKQGQWRKTNKASFRLSFAASSSESQSLDCGRPVNSTFYDHLLGVQNRAAHPTSSEPEVLALFFGSESVRSSKTLNVDVVQRRLLKARNERPSSVDLYIDIGNYNRIIGDALKAIECFRRALAVAPNHAQILLYLGRVLFKLKYLDDAIFLTRRSLEVQPPDQSAWRQHLQLGEILKAYSHYQEASLHLRHVLELKPDYLPALEALQELESEPNTMVHLYTLVIIATLVLVVLVAIARTMQPEEQVARSSRGSHASRALMNQCNGNK